MDATTAGENAGRAQAPGAGLGLALALVSAAALAYEILLTRLFSIIQWHHFAYMMISVALLGYGAAGSFVTVFRRRLDDRFASVFAASAALFGITSIASFLLAQRVPFNALEFLWDPRQPWWLALTYLLLFVPFFFAALCVCLMFTRFAARAARVYSFDILGAAAGCLGIVLLLFVLAPALALGCIGASGLLAAALALLSQRPRRQALAAGAARHGPAAAVADVGCGGGVAHVALQGAEPDARGDGRARARAALRVRWGWSRWSRARTCRFAMHRGSA